MRSHLFEISRVHFKCDYGHRASDGASKRKPQMEESPRQSCHFTLGSFACISVTVRAILFVWRRTHGADDTAGKKTVADRKTADTKTRESVNF